MKRLLSIVALGVATAGVVAAAPSDSGDPKIAYERYELDNGLEVILHRDNSVPLVAVNVWYHVGSGDEVPGKSGFAHLFEHMLFQGSKHVGEDMHFDILKKIGGSSVNGTTNTDRTNYFEVVPSHQLEVALWLESDRMGYLLPLLTQKSLENEIDVVRNERRQSYDNRAYAKVRFAAFEMLYPEGHPYRYLTIGKHEDLESATLTDVRNFYKTWYVPANATLTLAGDFDTDEVKQLIEKWFGGFPTTEKPEHHAPPTPALAETKRQVIEDDFAKLRLVQYIWHSPALYAPGDAELDILADALGRTGTGRLYKLLVHDKQLAQSVSVHQSSRGFSSTFTVGVMLRGDADLPEVEKLVNGELMKVIKNPIAQPELDRAVVNFESRFVWQLEGLMSRAQQLQSYNHFVGTPDYITQDLDRYRTTNVEAVRKVAETVLGQPRVEIVTVPAGKGGK